MKKAYDYRSAEDLIPLLRVLNLEIEERQDAMQQAMRRVHHLLRSLSNQKTTDEVSRLTATISTHKREIRFVKKELLQLGCSLDSEDPSTFRIPGRDGRLEGGFEWHVGDSRVQTHADN